MSIPRLAFLYPSIPRHFIRLRPLQAQRSVTPECIRRHATLTRHGHAVPRDEEDETPPKAPPPKISKEKEATESPSKEKEVIGSKAAREEAAKDKPSKAEAAGPPPPDPLAFTESTESATDPERERELLGQYAHHFDTHSCVSRLRNSGGFNTSQAVEITSALRLLLDKSFSSARQSLVSRSSLENETYLFAAAMSELRNEVQNARRMAVEELRTERNRIQTEFDLLNQAFLADVVTMKDELNGMFNDRKMTTRAEQRDMENKIQVLNYKITILMNSDVKSEIEKLRWITTRRGLMAIGGLALLVIANLKLSKSDKKNKEEAEKEADEEKKNELRIPPDLEHSQRHENGATPPDHAGANIVSLG